jgi:hypothetical protein
MCCRCVHALRVVAADQVAVQWVQYVLVRVIRANSVLSTVGLRVQSQS